MKAYELLAKPENWTKKANARDKEGKPVSIANPEAFCYCIYGAISKCYSISSEAGESILRINVKTGGSIAGWNDAPERTHEEVVELLKELNI